MRHQPFFVAYANSQGMTPDQVLERDRQAHPGGHMSSYLRWIAAQWHDFGAPIGVRNVTDDELARFSDWLMARWPQVAS